MSVPTPLNTGSLQATPIAHGNNSPNPKSLKVALDFSAGGTVTYGLDVGQLVQLQKIDQVVSIYIDNLANAAQCTVTFQSSGQSITAEPNSQGFYPALQANLGQITLTMSGGTAVTNVYLLNVETPYLVWGAGTSITGLNFDGAGNALVSDAKLDACISGNKVAVTDATLDSVVSGGALITHDQVLDAIVTGGKLPVTDASLDAIISGGALTTKDQGLDAIISGGALVTKDQGLDPIISGGALSTSLIGTTSGGLSSYAALGGTGNALLTNTPVQLKAGAGRLYFFQLFNTAAAVTYLQVFDALAGSVTLGTTVPKFVIPANVSAYPIINLGDLGMQFNTGLTVAACTTATGNTAPGTGLGASILFA